MVFGPITVDEGRPYGASIRDLASIGFIAEGFILEGAATVFSLTAGTDRIAPHQTAQRIESLDA